MGQKGLIGIVLAQSPEYVAPHGARKAVFGTNPIAISVPSENGAVTMDMATAAFAWFGVVEAQAAGKQVPEGVAMDAAGYPTTDPAQVLDDGAVLDDVAVLDGGAVRVFDKSYKGSNLALMVELLAGPLVGAAIADKVEEKNWGNLVAVLGRVKNAEKQPGVAEIMLPGERGNRLAAARLRSGSIPIEPNMLAQLKAMAAQYSPSAPPLTPSGYKTSTMLIHSDTSVNDPYGASMPPIWQTATFAQPSATTGGEYDYTRSGNPTRTIFEEKMAKLEGADRALAFTSGMAAIAVVTKLCKSGDHIVAGEDIYGGTSRLLSRVVPEYGVSVTNVDMTDLEAVRKAIIPGKTKLVIVESPTNPRMQICDIKALCDMAREVGAVSCVDNSIMTFLYQRPLDLGADISMTSGTKFIGGHGDVTLGVLAVKGEELAKQVYFLQNSEGAGLSPFDCWLALRGLKTMALRMDRSTENCAKLAAYLAKHPLVKKVNYASMDTHPDSDIHNRQATVGGALLSFTTGNIEASKTIVNETQLFKVTVSFGNVTSLISLPCFMSHASIPAEVREARGLPDDLVRISCGIEDIDDLMADLDQAMNKAMAAVGFTPSVSQTTLAQDQSADAEGNGAEQVTPALDAGEVPPTLGLPAATASPTSRQATPSAAVPAVAALAAPGPAAPTPAASPIAPPNAATPTFQTAAPPTVPPPSASRTTLPPDTSRIVPAPKATSAVLSPASSPTSPVPPLDQADLVAALRAQPPGRLSQEKVLEPSKLVTALAPSAYDWSIVSSTSSMALAACLMAAPLLGVVLPPPALAAVDSANVILEYQALEDKGQLDSPKALNDFRSKYNVKRTTDGRVMLKSSEDKWFTVRLDLDVGGTMLMRDPDGKMYAMQTEYLKQVDLSDDYIVLLMFADGEWEQGMFPLVPEDTEEPMNLSEKDFRQVMGLLDESSSSSSSARPFASQRPCQRPRPGRAQELTERNRGSPESDLSSS
eukprot:gene26364-17457_t